MRDSVVRAAGLAGTFLYGAVIAWLYVAQPQTVAEVTGGLTSTVGAYRIDQQAFDDGLGFFRREQFDEARAALARADPADATRERSSTSPTPSTGRAGDAFTTTTCCSNSGLAAVDRAIALAPDHRLVVDDAATWHAHRRRVARRAAARADARRFGLQPAPPHQAKTMTPLREAFALPCLFLTVALLGGLRLGADVRLVPPALIALVLAALLLGALIRSSVFAPERLLNQRRSGLENTSGGTPCLALFAASAQVFNLLTPDAGLLHVLVSVFFLVQLLTTLTAVRDRIAMLRSLAVLLGCAFVLRFIALESLYAPGRAVIKRVMTALMEGITLGALDYLPTGTANRYVAFLCLALYLVGLVLLPTMPTIPAIPTSDRDFGGGVMVSIGEPAEPDELHRHLPALRGE